MHAVKEYGLNKFAIAGGVASTAVSVQQWSRHVRKMELSSIIRHRFSVPIMQQWSVWQLIMNILMEPDMDGIWMQFRTWSLARDRAVKCRAKERIVWTEKNVQQLSWQQEKEAGWERKYRSSIWKSVESLYCTILLLHLKHSPGYWWDCACDRRRSDWLLQGEYCRSVWDFKSAVRL